MFITHSPKSHNNVQNVYFIHILLDIVAFFAYYAGIMLNTFATLLCSKLCWYNKRKTIV